MQLKQKLEFKRILAPQLQQSLKILTLPLTELKEVVSQELEGNPMLEESQPKDTVIVKIGPEKPPEKPDPLLSILEETDSYYYHDSKYLSKKETAKIDLHATFISKKMSLQEALLRQLGMFAASDEDFRTGQEIIGNIDENGYLIATIEEIAQSLNILVKAVENTLQLVQQFEPTGVGARSASECLLIQLKAAKEDNPLIEKIVKNHLQDVAKKGSN